MTYAVPSTGESDDGCLLFFDPKNARRIFYVHINRPRVHIGTFDPVHIGLLLSAKFTTASTAFAIRTAPARAALGLCAVVKAHKKETRQLRVFAHELLELLCLA